MNTWPDGEPVHDLTLYVRLSCGHECVSRGWRGNEEETYCCDSCKELVVIDEVSMTDESPHGWQYPQEKWCAVGKHWAEPSKMIEIQSHMGAHAGFTMVCIYCLRNDKKIIGRVVDK